MSEYKGKNESKSLKFLFQERRRYYGNVYEDENGDRKSGIVDINNFETVFFGRMDKNMNSITPKNSSIKYGSTTLIRGVNFAVDALHGFIDDFNTTLAMDGGYDESHPYLSKIKVYKSYQPPEVLYERYIARLMGKMIQQIQNNKDSNNIPDFISFVNYFLDFLQKKGSKSCFTKTAWQKSINSDIFTSGLAFSIANLDCGNDQQKTQFFSDGDNFNLYRQKAQDHGFSISLLCPWIIIADPDAASISDSHMGAYLNINNIINYNSTYDILYNKTYITDIIRLKNILRQNYNQFVLTFPFIKKFYFSKSKTTTTNQLRQQITQQEIESIYSDLQFQILYSKIRNIEEDNVFGKAEFDRLEKNTTFFHKKFDNIRSLGYINKQFRNSYYQKQGGLNYYLNKQNTIEEIDSED